MENVTPLTKKNTQINHMLKIGFRMETSICIISILIELFPNVGTFWFVFILINGTNQRQEVVANGDSHCLFFSKMANSKYGSSQEVVTELGAKIPGS